MDILEKIVKKRIEHINRKKATLPLEKLIKKTEEVPNAKDFIFEKALSKKDMSFICEIKHASPSKGIIVKEFPYLDIAREYESAKADAISVLTEPDFFLGSDSYLDEISNAVNTPLLRKDFIIDEYMIYEAKLLGANAILLIAAILEKETLAKYLSIAHELGLSVLVEAHTEKEVEKSLLSGANIIGVNNRNLKTFEVDLQISEKLRKIVPKDKLFVAESGIKTHDDIKILKDIGVDAVLIGETLMRASDKKRELDKLRYESNG